MVNVRKHFWFLVVFSTLIYFFGWMFFYKIGVNKLAIQSEDTLPAMFLPFSIVNEGTLYLDTFADNLIKAYPEPDDRSFEKGLIPFYLRKIEDHYLSAFQIITPLLVLPVYFLYTKLGLPVNFESATYLGHFSGGLIVAFSGAFLYLLLNKHFKISDRNAKLLSYIYLFGTINFALISQALWQHGTVELLLILTLWFLYEKRYFWMAFMLSLTVVARPTAIIVFPFLVLLFVEKSYENYKLNFSAIINFVLGSLPPVFFFFWYTNKYYIGLSNNGYSQQWYTGWMSKFPEGFIGLWLSPSKGILIYSPILIFSLIGLYFALRKGGVFKNFAFFIYGCIVFMHTLILGIWKHWYGGWSFGYRMASDIIPFLVLLIVPFITSGYFDKYKKYFMFLFYFSIAVQLFGLVFFDGIWHAAYDLGFRDTSWLWSIRDSEIAFNIRRMLVKFGVLDRACPHCLGIYE